MNELNPTSEEKSVMQNFIIHHSRTTEGQFVVPLPRKADAKPLGESRSQAVRRFLSLGFLSLERSLHSKNQFKEFGTIIEEYFNLGHAEMVPLSELHKSHQLVYYFPIHVVTKESSYTTKIRAVFDASAKSSTGVFFKYTLLVGPTVHPPLIDVLLCFQLHRIALTTDISKMYHAIELALTDRDYHHFVWKVSERSNP